MTDLKSRLREYLGQAERATAAPWCLQPGICGDGSLQDELAVSVCAEEHFGDGETMVKPLLEMKCDDFEEDDLNAAFIASSRTLGPLAASTLLEALELLEELALPPYKDSDLSSLMQTINARASHFLRELDQEGGG